MSFWKPLVACLVVAPCVLAQQSPLPAEGVIFDDFEYESVEWCREITGECDNNNPSGYPPEGSVFGRNIWHTSHNGDVDTSRAWYRFSWREDQGEHPHPSISLLSNELAYNGSLTFRAAPDSYPSNLPASAISSGFTARRGTWAARVNFGDLEPVSFGPMIQAFWLAGLASGTASDGTIRWNEIDFEWNNYFDNASHHFLSTGMPGRGTVASIPLFAQAWPDGNEGSPIFGDWSCKFVHDLNGPNETIANLNGHNCTRLLNKKTIWIGDCQEPSSSCTQYTPVNDPWIYLLVHVTDDGVQFQASSHGWGYGGATINAMTEQDYRTTSLPLRTLLSQATRGTVNQTEDFIVDWIYFTPNETTTLSDIYQHVNYLRNTLDIPRFNDSNLDLERPYKHMAGIYSVAEWGDSTRTSALSLDFLHPPSMAPGEQATLVALPPLRHGHFRWTWSCSTIVLQLNAKAQSPREVTRLDEPIPCYAQRQQGGWEADFTFPTEPEVTAVKITVTLKELMSSNDPTVINNDLIYPITESFWIFRDNSLTSDVKPAAAHQTGGGVPAEFSLGQNVPNAFASQTEIPFALPEPHHVSLAVYDVLGREVARLVEGELEAGYHRAVFDASGLPAGVYVYRLQAGEYVESRRMVVAR